MQTFILVSPGSSPRQQSLHSAHSTMLPTSFSTYFQYLNSRNLFFIWLLLSNWDPYRFQFAHPMLQQLTKCILSFILPPIGMIAVATRNNNQPRTCLLKPEAEKGYASNRHVQRRGRIFRRGQYYRRRWWHGSRSKSGLLHSLKWGIIRVETLAVLLFCCRRGFCHLNITRNVGNLCF